MTVEEIIELTSEKRETIEEFKAELQRFGLIGKHQSLNLRAVTTFRRAVEYSVIKKDWSDSIQRAIQEEYGEEMELPFTWLKKAILDNLIWKINNERVNVVRVGATEGHNEDYHVVFEIIIENFAEMGKTIDVFKESFGTDGNSSNTFVCKGKDYTYYLVGKWNHVTKNEDMHVFYNDGIEFNPMKCEHICGGNSEKGILQKLLQACSSSAPELK